MCSLYDSTCRSVGDGEYGSPTSGTATVARSASAPSSLSVSAAEVDIARRTRSGAEAWARPEGPTYVLVLELEPTYETRA